MFARDALALLLVMVPATATTAENDSQSANSIMPGCDAWIAQLSRGSAALGSNVFLAGECLGIVGTILYFSRDFSFSSAACPPPNVTYNRAVQVVTAYITARPQRIHERFIDLATEALHDAWPCKPNLK
jgi:Rap1a immunity proteins